MKILKLQRKLEIDGFITGFIISALFHIALIIIIFIYKPYKKEVNPINITKIDLEFFEIGGGLNDAPPAKDVEPVEQIEEVEIIKEAIEPEPIQEEIVEVVKKEKPKPVKKQKKVQKQQQDKKVENKQQNEQKTTLNSGYNAYNPNSNKIASSSITGQNTSQSLTPAQKADIGAQIQAIIAKQAQKNYPRAARKMRKQGVCIVAFTYHEDGSITNLKVAKSSGHKILDDTVISVIQSVKHKFPKIDVSTTFEVPIKFTLK
ncbi:energy transducer TonB [Campylobacter sputorum]|uniref:energy transducer TonB n=1 Tax=Campylobacter sputorum TaxID=206 RepID=UPI00053BEDEB|nr:energy transducer TonB [Campylobacter sputorum]